MKIHRSIVSLSIAAALTLVAVATRAEAPPGTPPETPSDSHGEQVSGTATATASINARTDLEALKRKIEEQGAKVSADARAKAEVQINSSSRDIDQHASLGGEAKIAGRLADEFGISADAILAEKAALGATWGELTIAHSIAANSNSEVTVEQLLALRKEGMGWGRIAAGLDLKLGTVVSGIRAESQVARGIVRADGKVAAMQGAGARGGLGANAGLHTGVGKGKAGVGAGVGAGVKVKP